MASNNMLTIDEVLADDNVINIIARLPPDDLAACLEVNRNFNRMINDPTFKPRETRTTSDYLARSRHGFSFVADSTMKCTGTIASKPEEPGTLVPLLKKSCTRIEAVSQCRLCSGLVCFVDKQPINDRYYVCKLVTKQCRSLPSPKLRFQTAATAIIASFFGQGFKIVRFSLPRNRELYVRCEIFDSRKWSWHRSKDIKENISFSTLERCDGTVFTHGSVHWLTERGIFAFHVNKETWKWIELPVDFSSFEGRCWKKITLRDGKLCLVLVKHDREVVIWMMDKYKEVRWGVREVIDFKELNQEEQNWLRLYLDLFYSANCGHWNDRLSDEWKDFWNDKLDADKMREIIGDVFKFESNEARCKALDKAPSCSKNSCTP